MVEGQVRVHVLPCAAEASDDGVPADEVDERVGTEDTGDDGESGAVGPDVVEHQFWLAGRALSHVSRGTSIV